MKEDSNPMQRIMQTSSSAINQINPVPMKIPSNIEKVLKPDLDVHVNPTISFVVQEVNKTVQTETETNGTKSEVPAVEYPLVLPLKNQEMTVVEPQQNQTTSTVEPQEVGSDQPMENPGILTVREPNRNDVLFGRGGGTNFHQGNMNYRAKIKSKQRDYINARQRAIKTIIISDIISQVRDDGGRFLKQDDNNKLWYEVDDKEVKKKTSQTLREGAPQWRKANGEWQRRVDHSVTVSQPGMVIQPSSQQSDEVQIAPRIVSADDSIGPVPGSAAVIPSGIPSQLPGPNVIPPSAVPPRNPSQPPPQKKKKTEPEVPGRRTAGLDLLSDVAFLHSVNEKKVQKVTTAPPPPQPPASELALQKWRREHKDMLDRVD